MGREGRVYTYWRVMISTSDISNMCGRVCTYRRAVTLARAPRYPSIISASNSINFSKSVSLNLAPIPSFSSHCRSMCASCQTCEPIVQKKHGVCHITRIIIWQVKQYCLRTMAQLLKNPKRLTTSACFISINSTKFCTIKNIKSDQNQEIYLERQKSILNDLEDICFAKQ